MIRFMLAPRFDVSKEFFLHENGFWIKKILNIGMAPPTERRSIKKWPVPVTSRNFSLNIR